MASSTSPPAAEQPTGQGSDPQWLDADERNAWLALNRLVTRLPSALDAQLERDADLNYFEYLVLAILSEQPDRTLRIKEIAAATNASLSRLSHVAKRLEGRGLLHRQNDPDDGRCTQARLTDTGMTSVIAAAPGHVATVRALVIDALTPAQLRHLNTANHRILDRIDAASPAAPAPSR